MAAKKNVKETIKRERKLRRKMQPAGMKWRNQRHRKKTSKTKIMKKYRRRNRKPAYGGRMKAVAKRKNNGQMAA
jgi:hypothetical protein